MTGKMIEVFEVATDLETGEWLAQPTPTGETVDWSDWNKKADTDSQHFDTYEAPIFDEYGDRIGEETRALIVTWR